MSQPTRPGDWMCPNCNFLIFARKSSCNKCGVIKLSSNNTAPSVKRQKHGGRGRCKPKARTERQRQKQQQRADKRAQKLLENERKRMERERDRTEKSRQNEERRKQRKLKKAHKKTKRRNKNAYISTPNIPSTYSTTTHWNNYQNNCQQEDKDLATALQSSQQMYYSQTHAKNTSNIINDKYKIKIRFLLTDKQKQELTVYGYIGRIYSSIVDGKRFDENIIKICFSYFREVEKAKAIEDKTVFKSKTSEVESETLATYSNSKEKYWSSNLYSYNALESVYHWLYTSTQEDRRRRSDDSDFEEYPEYPYDYNKRSNRKSKSSYNWSIFGPTYERHSGNKSDSGCIDGNGMVLMSDDTYKLISELNVNEKVKSFPNGVSKIVAVIISDIGKEIKMVNLNGCWITYKHPILVRNDNKCVNDAKYNELGSMNMDKISESGLKWVFPQNVCNVDMRYEDKVYNFVLDNGHMINVNGNWCVTLGDGYDKGQNIGCELWSDMEMVKMYLEYHKSNNTHVVVKDNMCV